MRVVFNVIIGFFPCDSMNFYARTSKRLEIVEKEAVEIYSSVGSEGVRLEYRSVVVRQRLLSPRA
jgi:hypothetical protein